ncbi:hypothetical protein Syun_006655 [Stephania yunnanensis]|uniref:Uncharacterized protein n=1 Tax=Stephania yunnanensis TaxID=152371 RepID=A0AAP0PZI5_9MAGN
MVALLLIDDHHIIVGSLMHSPHHHHVEKKFLQQMQNIYWNDWRDKDMGIPVGVNNLFLHVQTINHKKSTFVDERSRRLNEELQMMLEEMM